MRASQARLPPGPRHRLHPTVSHEPAGADGIPPASAEYAAPVPKPLPEFARYRPRAGHPDWPRLAAEARDRAGRLLPRLERPRRGPAELSRRARAYGTAAANYAENRRLARAGREDLRPLYFIWTLVRVCNFRCDYCDDHRGQRYPDLPRGSVLSTEEGAELLRIMRTGTPSVYFAGGEPLLRSDLPALTRSARDLSYYPIILNTNGALVHRVLEKERWRSWLADTDVVIVSLDGLDLAWLDRTWVTRRSHEVIRNLLLLRELSNPLRFKLLVNTVILPGQAARARDVLDLCGDLGLWFTPVPVNAGPRIDGSILEDPDYLRLAELILERKRAGDRITGSTRLNRRLLFSEEIECRNTIKPHIDVDGRLFWPCKASVHVAPELIRVLDFEDVDSLYEHARRLIEPTRFAGPARNQCGARCNWAQNYTTDAYARGLHHPCALVSDVLEFVRSR